MASRRHRPAWGMTELHTRARSQEGMIFLRPLRRDPSASSPPGRFTSRRSHPIISASGTSPSGIGMTIASEAAIGRGIAERVRTRWQASGVGARAGALPEEVAGFEDRYRLSLPPSVRDFYAAVNGMEPGGIDEGLFVAFPLAELRPIPEAVGAYGGTPDYRPIVRVLPDCSDYFVFGECMIWLNVVAVRLRPTGPTPVLWICGSTFIPLARTFDEFWEAFLRDPSATLNGRPASGMALFNRAVQAAGRVGRYASSLLRR